MSELTCVRCGRKAPSLENAPFPGSLGASIHQKVCAACWAEWEKNQTMIVNEYRLNLGNPHARETLIQQMKQFLNLALG